MVVESVLSALLLLGPPVGTTLEGPAAEDPDVGSDPVDDDDSLDTGADADADTGADTGADETDDPASAELDAGPDIDAIVEAAAQTAKERAWLERNGQDVDAYVRQLDALADVNAELDGCGRAIQAELRMALALAYLQAEGTCPDDDEPSTNAETPEALPLPVLECYELAGPGPCADHLLELVAAFASEGQGGTKAPFSQAFGCPHAVAEMSVEQMFGACMDEQYDAAVDRWSQTDRGGDQPEAKVWPVPRWAGITGVSVGAALVVGGAVLLAIDGTCPGGYDPVTQVDQCPSVYDTNVGGGVMLGVGAVVMLGMGTVLTVTEIQRKRRGDGRSSALRRRLDRAEALTGLRLSPRRQPLMLRL